MSAPQKVTDPQVRAALELWNGNVAAAADSLGLSEYGLRKRMERMGLGDRALFYLRARNSNNQPTATMAPATGRGGDNRNHREKPEANKFTENGGASNLLAMPSASQEEGAEPMVGRQRRPGPIRLRPDQVAQLTEAKYDFVGKRRVDAKENDLLQLFFDQSFAEWLKRTLSDKKAKA